MKRESLCVVCASALATSATGLCRRCLSDYDKNAHNEGSVAEVIAWAARRTRRFAQKAKP